MEVSRLAQKDNLFSTIKVIAQIISYFNNLFKRNLNTPISVPFSSNFSASTTTIVLQFVTAVYFPYPTFRFRLRITVAGN